LVLAVGLAAAVLAPRPGWCSPAQAAAQPADGDLRLVVLVVIDQLRGDSLERYDRLFGPDGFRRLRDGGVWYQNAFFDHAHTVTAPGHATIGTGAHPAAHGIIGNDWIDRVTGRSVGCVADPASPVVGAESTGNGSPIQLLATTFSDEWIFATAGRARAFGVSGKDRGAILPIGKTGKAFWYHGSSGRMVSSRYYYPELPPWAGELNRAGLANRYSGKSWERATRDDDGVPSATDDRSFETNASGLGRTFPHRLALAERGRGGGGGGEGGGGRAAGDGGVARGGGDGGSGRTGGNRDRADAGADGDDDAAESTGADDAGRSDAAAEAGTGRDAGSGRDGDSGRDGGSDRDAASDRDGGSGRGGFGRGGFGRGTGGRGGFGRGGFGQGRLTEQVRYTPFGDDIVLDFALELVRAEELGKRSALDILVVSLSSNDIVGHAYGPDSVEAKELAYSLDRQVARLLAALDESIGPERYICVLTSDHGVAYSPEAVSAVGLAAKRYSHSEMARQIRRRLSFTVRYLEWDAGFSASGFYFDPEALIHGGVPAESLQKTAADIIRGTRGIASAYTRSQILSGDLPDTDMARRVRASYHEARSPDVFLVPEPYWIEGTGTASHGTPHTYDTHVPLVFYGAGLPPERVLRTVSMKDIASTLTSLLGCSAPSANQGEPLREVLAGVTRKPYRR
jgi:hypothetical protein